MLKLKQIYSDNIFRDDSNNINNNITTMIDETCTK